MKAISSLNANKAPDIHSITAEHLKNAPPNTVGWFRNIINKILELKRVPGPMKEGVLTPVYKNKESKLDPYSYRGITVTPVTGKVLEILIKNFIISTLFQSQRRLQAGFTRGASPLNAAFLIQECIAQAKSMNEPLYIALLDVKTAFDVVTHSSLNRKLFQDGIKGDLWKVIWDLQKDAITRIKWKNHLSEPFKIQQGVRQGESYPLSFTRGIITHFWNNWVRLNRDSSSGLFTAQLLLVLTT